MTDKAAILKNIEDIQSSIAAAAARAGRDPAAIRLMAVTKTKPPEVVECLIEAGMRCFGENYPDETAEKIGAFRTRGDVSLAMIGHLQSRKAKIVADLFDEYHALDRLEIAEKMESLCAARERVMPVMIECNVGDEVTKGGWHFADDSIPEAFLADFEKIAALPHLDVRGLMILPPFTENGEENRKYFVRTRNIAEYLNAHCGAHISELSMGTSADYAIAVEEGATIVRIGTALVGPRQYKDKA